MMGNAQIPETGSGEERLQQYRKRYARVMSGLLAAGGLIGAVMGMALGLHFGFRGFADTRFPPFLQGLAVVSAVTFIIVVIVGSLIYFRTVDELEVEANKIAGLIGINVYALLYMTWWPLSKMQVTPPPSGEAIFLITMAATIVAFCWRRFR